MILFKKPVSTCYPVKSKRFVIVGHSMKIAMFSATYYMPKLK